MNDINPYILKVSKNEQAHKLQSETFCLNEFKEEMKIYAEQELEKAGKSHVNVEIFKDYYVEKYWIHTDRKCLRQTFTILLDNAIKHTDTGYILFDFHISIISPVRNNVRFFVDDTGNGIYDENDPNLSIAQGLIEQMGGEMKIHPAGEAGTSIKFDIMCYPCEIPAN